MPATTKQLTRRYPWRTRAQALGPPCCWLRCQVSDSAWGRGRRWLLGKGWGEASSHIRWSKLPVYCKASSSSWCGSFAGVGSFQGWRAKVGLTLCLLNSSPSKLAKILFSQNLALPLRLWFGEKQERAWHRASTAGLRREKRLVAHIPDWIKNTQGILFVVPRANAGTAFFHSYCFLRPA